MISWIWLATVLTVLGLYLRQVYSRFSRHGVRHFTPVPILGNFTRILFRLENFADNIEKTYKAFRAERFVGRYDFISPIVIIQDLELIKRITVKDFEHFLDHRVLVNQDNDPLFGRNLFTLKGDEWKDMRSTLSPAFTSSKIRLMVPFMVEVGDQMIKALKKKILTSRVDYIDIDAKDLTTRYANDVIASCAFGLKVDSHADELNDFYLKGKEASDFGSLWQFIKFFGFASFPKLMKYLKLSVFSEEIKHFFRSLVMTTMQDREERHIVRPDMIHLLMQAKKGKLSHDHKATVDADAGFATVEESAVGKKYINRVWTDDDLVAQALIFFLAGFETVSTAMSFLTHELAVNPEVQEKLLQEIRENEVKNGGKFDYNSIQEMKYLDMVVSEVLRLWSPAVGTDRICKNDYNLGKPNDRISEDYIIRKGETAFIPIWAIHRDPIYFPNPSKFNPERFSEKYKHNIKPFTYMPFGLGPRNCIGSRFALCEVKVMAYQLLQAMELSPAAKTQIPAKLSKQSLRMRIEGGHWVRLRARN